MSLGLLKNFEKEKKTVIDKYFWLKISLVTIPEDQGKTGGIKKVVANCK